MEMIASPGDLNQVDSMPNFETAIRNAQHTRLRPQRGLTRWRRVEFTPVFGFAREGQTPLGQSLELNTLENEGCVQQYACLHRLRSSRRSH